MWQESNDPPVWRAILESPTNGERHGFSDLQALFVFLKQETQQVERSPLSKQKPLEEESCE
jgi:hypothetical protein